MAAGVQIERALAGFERLSIPSGESPDGKGQWPVPPKNKWLM